MHRRYNNLVRFGSGAFALGLMLFIFVPHLNRPGHFFAGLLTGLGAALLVGGTFYSRQSHPGL